MNVNPAWVQDVFGVQSAAQIDIDKVCLPSINPSNAEANFVQSTRNANIFEKHLNLVMLVFIG